MRGGLRILAAVALVAALPFVKAQAAASNVSSLSASLSSSQVSATGVTLTLTMVTSGVLPTGSEIVWQLNGSPSSFDLSGVTSSNLTSSTLTGTAAVSTFNNETSLRFTTTAAASAGTHIITLSNIGNPSTSSTGSIVLSTTGFTGMQSGATSTTTVTVGSGGGDGGNGGDNGGGPGEDGGAQITGDNSVTVTVTDEAGAALANQNVFAYCGMSYQAGETDDTGEATITDLTNGNCGVWLASSEYYAEKENFTFPSTDEAKTKAISFSAEALDTTAEITVTKPDGSAAPEIYIFMTDSEGREFSGGTDSNGQVSFGLFYGSYVLNGYIGSRDSSDYVPETTFTISADGIATDNNVNEISVQLQEYSAFITGTITSSSGEPLSGPRVLAYSPVAMRFLEGETDGTYSVGVLPGTYTVKGEADGYANGTVKNIVVSEGETVTGQDIVLEDAPNTLNLTMVDSAGDTVVTDGFIFCKDPEDLFEPASVYFDRITDGTASFNFPDGEFQCTANVTGYVSESSTFAVGDGETEIGDITITAYNSTLSVTLEDQDGNVLNNVRFGVFGQSADGQSLSGYSIGEAVDIGALAGTYTLRAYVMGGAYTSDYNNPTSVTLTEGGSESITLTVYTTPATLTGNVTDAADAAVAGAAVKASCVTGSGKTFEFTTSTDAAGDYSLATVNGSCVLNAAMPDGSSLPSGDETVTVTGGDTVEHDLQLQDSTATLRITPSAAAESGDCYAYNSAGVYVTAEVDSTTNKANVPVLAGEWSYGCRIVSNDKVKVSAADAIATVGGGDTEAVVATVASADDNFENLVFQFSATSDNTITLPDGTEIFVPANALDNSGNVTINASMATQVASEDDVAAGPAVELTARDSNNREITGSFNGDVTITFNYTKGMLNKYGLTEGDLQGGYSYSDGALAVTDQGYTMDTANNTVTVTTDHFSTFTLAGVKVAAPSLAKHLQAKQLTANSARLTWRQPSSGSVTRYKLQLRKHGVKKTSKWTTYKRVTKTHKAIAELLANTRYQFRVAACNGADCSAYTDWKAFRTR